MNADHEEKLLAIERAGENMWTFMFPRLTWEVLEEFHEALEYWRAGYLTDAEEEYLWLLERFPEFIDVHHHRILAGIVLAEVFDKTTVTREAFVGYHYLIKRLLFGAAAGQSDFCCHVLFLLKSVERLPVVLAELTCF